MSSLLAIETSTDACSVALRHGGVLHVDHRELPRGHARALLPAIDDLLRAAELGPGELSGVVYGRGPGSFTGMRIGCAVAQGLAWAHDLPALGISSLAALACSAVDGLDETKGVVTLLDARMDEVYAAAYGVERDGTLREVVPERLGAPEAVLPALTSCVSDDGSGWMVTGDALGLDDVHIRALLARPALRLCVDTRPRADALLRLADQAPTTAWGDASSVQPVYLQGKARWRRQAGAAASSDGGLPVDGG